MLENWGMRGYILRWLYNWLYAERQRQYEEGTYSNLRLNLDVSAESLSKILADGQP